MSGIRFFAINSRTNSVTSSREIAIYSISKSYDDHSLFSSTLTLVDWKPNLYPNSETIPNLSKRSILLYSFQNEVNLKWAPATQIL